MEEEELYCLLIQRGVSKDRIQALKSDKIDKDCIGLLSEEQLQQYIPVLGDRLLVKERFGGKHKQPDFVQRKQSLFNQLRSKMGLPAVSTSLEDPPQSKTGQPNPSKRMKGNKIASKPTRKLELGWLHEGKQVRKKNGGGTRSVSLSKDAMKTSLMEKGKELFFPKGISKMATLEEVSCDILDYKEVPFPDSVTVGELYEEVKMGVLRFYLCTHFKESSSSSDSTMRLADKASCSCTASRPESKTAKHLQSVTSPDSLAEPLLSFQEPGGECVIFDTVTMREPHCNSLSVIDNTLDESGVISFGAFENVIDNSVQLEDTLPFPAGELDEWEDSHIALSPVRSATVPLTRHRFQPAPPPRSPTPPPFSSPTPPAPRNPTPTPPRSPTLPPPSSPTPPAPRSPTPPPPSSPTPPAPRSPTPPPTRSPTPPPTRSPTPPPPSSPTPPASRSSTPPPPRSPTPPPPSSPTPPAPRSPTPPPPRSPTPPPPSSRNPHPPRSHTPGALADPIAPAPRNSPGTTYIYINRVNVVNEMIGHFKNPDIVNAAVKFAFVGELGADNQGVSREAYCAFWQEFMIGAAEGEDGRVPAVNEEWMEEEWKAVGRILLKGYRDHDIFPLQLNEAFVVALIHGEAFVSPDMFQRSFLAFLCPTDRDLLTAALAGQSDPADREELIDFFDRMYSNRIPSQAEMIPVVLNLAHKELVRRPSYALERMSEAVGGEFSQLLPTVQSVSAMYEEKKPTSRKVLSKLQGHVTSKAEDDSLKYLRQFIRSLDNRTLGRFCRFLTGFDTTPDKVIEIMFTNTVGLARRPIAHTCGPTLELPCTYSSYPDFRREFQSILSHDENFKMEIA